MFCAEKVTKLRDDGTKCLMMAVSFTSSQKHVAHAFRWNNAIGMGLTRTARGLQPCCMENVTRVPMQIVRLSVFAAIVAQVLVNPALALSPAPEDCEAIAAKAGLAAGLPDGILPAISRVESSYKGRAWPWTLNQGGNGTYHATKADALAALNDILASGVKNVDLGCMQINWRWHSQAFLDAETMIDPFNNTLYAATFLAKLFEKTGDWDIAIGLYHSNDPARSAAYRDKVMAMLDKMGHDAPAADAPVVMAAADNQGMLLVARAPLVTRLRGQDMRATFGRPILPGRAALATP